MGVAGKMLLMWLCLNVVILTVFGVVKAEFNDTVLDELGEVNDSTPDNATSLNYGSVKTLTSNTAVSSLEELALPGWLISLMVFIDTAAGVILAYQTFIGG